MPREIGPYLASTLSLTTPAAASDFSYTRCSNRTDLFVRGIGKCGFQTTAPGSIDRFLCERPSVSRLDWRESGKNGHLNVAATTARSTEVSDKDASVAVSCALSGSDFAYRIPSGRSAPVATTAGRGSRMNRRPPRFLPAAGSRPRNRPDSRSRSDRDGEPRPC